MKAFLDELPLASAGQSLASAVRAAGDEASRRGRVVVEVKLDGATLAGDALDHPSDAPIEPGRELRFTTTDPVALARTSLLDGAELLERVRQVQRESAAALQAGDFARAMAGLGESVEAWDTVRRVVDGTSALLGLDLSTLRTADGTPGGAGSTVTESIESLAKLLEQVRNALAVQDWSALGDVLEFDLDEQAARWDQVLRGIAAAARAAR